MSPRVSVITIAYNGAAYIRDAVESVLSQTEKSEIIVVDDASTDGTADVLKSYSSRIVYLRHDTNSGGCSAPRNTGIQAANGRYLVFLDSDDVLTNENLSVMADFMDQNPDIGLAFSDYSNWTGDSTGPAHTNSCGRFRSLLGPAKPGEWMVIQKENVYRALIEENFIGVCALMVRKSLIDEIGGFDVSLKSSEDIDFTFRAARTSDFAFWNQIGFKRRMHADNMTRNDILMTERKLMVRKKQSNFVNDRETKEKLERQIEKLVVNMSYQHRRSGDYGAALSVCSSNRQHLRPSTHVLEWLKTNGKRFFGLKRNVQ